MNPILGIDPGETTGWCFFDPDNIKGCSCGEIPAASVFDIECLFQPEVVVVVESFRLYPWKSEAMSWNRFIPVEVIGIVKGFCRVRQVEYLEQPASIKQIVTRPMLTAFDLWRKTRGKPHARDAARHALYHYMRLAPDHVVSATLAAFRDDEEVED